MVSKNWTGMCKKMNLEHLIIPHTTTNSKQIKDLSIGLKAIKVLEESIGSKISDIPRINILFRVCPWARETKINK